MGKFKLKPQNIRYSTFKVGEVARMKDSKAIVEIVRINSNLSYHVKFLEVKSGNNITYFKHITSNGNYKLIFASDLVKDATANTLYGS